MRYSIIHCYSDLNKGDAGIILSIIDLINFADDTAVINIHSTFSSLDKRILTSHYLTSPFVEKTLPAIFPEPYISKKGDSKRTLFPSILNFSKFLFRGLLLLSFPNAKFVYRLFPKGERASINDIRKSDFIISKGGSFLYSFNSMRGMLFFFRVFFPFLFAFRLKKKVVIFSQSVGPLETKLSQYLFKRFSRKFFKIYLRESKCLELFDNLRIKYRKNIEVIPDAAFYLNGGSVEKNNVVDSFCGSGIRVGITVRYHKFYESTKKNQFETYLDSIVASCSRLIEERDASIVFFPQVIGPSKTENDLLIMKRVEAKFGDRFHNHLLFIEDDISPRELKSLYGRMDIFIGTRLHSSIFALALNIPTINISYHGTKSFGIYSTLGLEDFVLDINDINEEKLYNAIEKIIRNRDQISSELEMKLPQFKQRLESAILELTSL